MRRVKNNNLNSWRSVCYTHIEQRSANFSCNGPEKKYFGQSILIHYLSTLPSNTRAAIDKNASILGCAVF